MVCHRVAVRSQGTRHHRVVECSAVFFSTISRYLAATALLTKDTQNGMQQLLFMLYEHITVEWHCGAKAHCTIVLNKSAQVVCSMRLHNHARVV